jgi:hypothetical protein
MELTEGLQLDHVAAIPKEKNDEIRVGYSTYKGNYYLDFLIMDIVAGEPARTRQFDRKDRGVKLGLRVLEGGSA